MSRDASQDTSDKDRTKNTSRTSDSSSYQGWSAGSLPHLRGQCRPCKFVARKLICEKGANCPDCHLSHRSRRSKSRRSRKALEMAMQMLAPSEITDRHQVPTLEDPVSGQGDQAPLQHKAIGEYAAGGEPTDEADSPRRRNTSSSTKLSL
eukprot:gnl/TRDRNA2_/TRDRNA2_201351_c0_seq1.p1 gnl/TRDRNA2_/TRDRNA2_201351_c0~~gnl/TRDRNA2_/TRDRNA2_201351_c0_seq1.p1  ORF type:complete len:150 (-),score=14.06 gnl/TRDRNA2_/TRDRNA2_201351_c0_seq1:210-659(-)